MLPYVFNELDGHDSHALTEIIDAHKRAAQLAYRNGDVPGGHYHMHRACRVMVVRAIQAGSDEVDHGNDSK